MSAPSSPPTNSAYVPYQAYKSKRHSRNLSNNSHLAPNQSPPQVSRPATSLFQSQSLLDTDDDGVEEPIDSEITPLRLTEISNDYSSNISVEVDHPVSPDQPPVFIVDSQSSSQSSPHPIPRLRATSGGEGTEGTFSRQGDDITMTSQAPAQPNSAGPSTPTHTHKKVSTFRRLPAKKNQHAPTPSHTHSASTNSLLPRFLDDKPLDNVTNETTGLSLVKPHATLAPLVPEPEIHIRSEHIPPLQIQQSTSQSSRTSTGHVSRPSSIHLPTRLNSPSATSSPKSAPYRPGFQPKGVYRPLTDEFISRRRSIHEGEGEGGMARVERTKLERRLEKLIMLHFPSPERGDKESRPTVSALGHDNRRASSLFDFQTLKNFHDAGSLWKGVITRGLGDTVKMDIRAQEQRITPWQDDAAVSKCPLCSAAFHPLTNRKHHCRLCGQIICSLPIKHPQRRVLCSILFVVDTNTREIEEVWEGVDYGVSKRKTSTTSGPQIRQEEDKFLKGVRICRDCRPILLRQQYYQQARSVPVFARMYERFIHLETDIEEYLPKFQELLMTLNHHDQPTKEASVARKRLLESFAQYDRLSKEIRALPCPNGPGSSQDRVQAAIMTRANLFLQKNMFPLQSLPTPQSNGKNNKPAKEDTNGTAVPSAVGDPDSALAHALQPLLEQETLLETFVEEAQAQRKFEDVKTLKVNLAEIRQEIENVLAGKKI